MSLEKYNSISKIERLNTLMARINLAKGLEGFRQRRWSSISEYPIFYALIALYEVDNVIECGTNAGVSALSFAAGLMNTGKPGKVYTWDIDKIKGVDEGTNLEEKIVKYIQSFPEAQIQRPEGKLLIFIDGDHNYESALIDLKHVLSFIKTGDVLVVHDVFKHPPVKDAINTFLNYNPKKYKEIPSSTGIGVIEW